MCYILIWGKAISQGVKYRWAYRMAKLGDCDPEGGFACIVVEGDEL